jgi:hypothetical protein
MNIFLTQEVLDKYNDVWNFIVKLKFCMKSIDDARIETSESLDRLRVDSPAVASFSSLSPAPRRRLVTLHAVSYVARSLHGHCLSFSAGLPLNLKSLRDGTDVKSAVAKHGKAVCDAWESAAMGGSKRKNARRYTRDLMDKVVDVAATARTGKEWTVTEDILHMQAEREFEAKLQFMLAVLQKEGGGSVFEGLLNDLNFNYFLRKR